MNVLRFLIVCETIMSCCSPIVQNLRLISSPSIPLWDITSWLIWSPKSKKLSRASQRRHSWTCFYWFVLKSASGLVLISCNSSMPVWGQLSPSCIDTGIDQNTKNQSICKWFRLILDYLLSKPILGFSIPPKMHHFYAAGNGGSRYGYSARVLPEVECWTWTHTGVGEVKTKLNLEK